MKHHQEDDNLERSDYWKLCSRNLCLKLFLISAAMAILTSSTVLHVTRFQRKEEDGLASTRVDKGGGFSEENGPSDHKKKIIDTVSDSTAPFSAAKAPLLKNYVPSREQPVRIRHFGAPQNNVMKHIFADGIRTSEFLELAGENKGGDYQTDNGQPDESVLITSNSGLRKWCDEIAMWASSRREETDWHVLVWMYDDSPVLNLIPIEDCDLEPSRVRIVIRSIVEGRFWNEDSHRVDLGRIIPEDSAHNWSTHPMIHSPFTVRSDIVSEMERVILEMDADPHPLRMNRTAMDVAHFWPIDRSKKFTVLRNTVSKTVASLDGKRIGGRRIRTLADQVGYISTEGRHGVHQDYVKALLTTKIVVVAQRDEWEDHWRLFEALAGGALVMSDVMLSLPEGYSNGTNIVLYRDHRELKRLLRYYLVNERERMEIAWHGWTTAMRNHRPWHRLEQIFFGRTISSSFSPFLGSSEDEG